MRPARPPLPRFAVAWFPSFAGLERIESFRRRHDPAAVLVPAHLSLVFPFSTALSKLQIQTHVQRIAARWPPIPVTFRRVRTEANEFVFLMASRGASSIKGLHDELYTRSLAHNLRPELPYEPHITIGRHADYGALQAALAEAQELFQDEFTAVIRDATLVAVGRTGKITRLQTFALNSA